MWPGRLRAALIPGLLLQGMLMPAVAATPIDYVLIDEVQPEQIIDVRPLAVCRQATLPGARCLPVSDAVGPQRKPANISGLLWLFGSAGLDGSGHLLLVGERLQQQELMAALLYLAGQQQISILRTPLSQLAASGRLMRPGRPRSNSREQVYQAPMRDAQLLLRSELQRRLAAGDELLLLDGRSEAEYWGQRIRGLRGGHIPGAQLVSMTALDDELPPLLPSVIPGVGLVVYGHDALQGLVYLARLVERGLTPQLFIGGWASWSADGGLPADSVTYRDQPVKAARPMPFSSIWRVPWLMLLMVLFSLGLSAAAGFYLGRCRRK